MILDARAETEYKIGQEFRTEPPTRGGDPQTYTVVGFRGEFIFLMMNGQKDGQSDRVISQMAAPMVRKKVIDGRGIIETTLPPERLREFSMAEEVVVPATPFNDGLKQVDIVGLEPGGRYRLLGRHIDAGRIHLPGQFLKEETERAALLFDLHKGNDGLLPLVGGQNSVSILEIRKGILSLPTHLISSNRVTIWTPARAS